MYSLFRRISWKSCLAGLALLAASEAQAKVLTSPVHQIVPPPQTARFGSAPKNFAFHSGYGQLPMAFEANEGQVDSRVRFIARGNSYCLFLTDLETVMSLNVYDKNPVAPSKGKPPGPKLLGQDVLRLSLTGASRGISFEARNPLPGVSNYFPGGDSSQWKTNIKQYSQVVAHEAYPGIDVVYYGKQGQLEYDFHVKPGADPKVIRIQHQGAAGAAVDEQGNLRLRLGRRSLQFKAPTVYQVNEGVTQMVSGKYVVTAPGEIGFEIAAYDKTKTLIIDPALDYSTYLGGINADAGYSIAVDSSGNAYVAGATAGDFPITAGAYQTTYTAGSSYVVFVTKMNPTGTALVYSTYLGQSGWDLGYGVAVDAAGDAYVTGETTGTFPETAGAYQTAFLGNVDAFVTKLNPAGNGLIYSTYLGKSGTNESKSIAINAAGDAFITGYTDVGTFPTTSGAYQTTAGGAGDAFITELNAAGSALVYSTFLGGNNEEFGNAIALDTGGKIYVAGYTYSTNYPTTAGAYLTTSPGGQYAFAAKINPAGGGASDLVYSTYLGPTDSCNGIAVDSSNCAYVTGETNGGYPTTAGAFQPAYGGAGDAFVTKLNAAGSALVYSTYLGGSSTDNGACIVVDANGNAYVTGYAESGNFPTTAGAYQTTLLGSPNAFLTVLNPSGSGLVYSTYLGGTVDDFGYGIALDSSGSIYLTGTTFSTNFPTTAGAYQTTLEGGQPWGGDAFVTKFDASDFYTSTPTPNLTATPTNTPLYTATFTNSPTVTSTPTLTSTATLTTTPPATNTPTATATPTFTSSVTDTATVTSTFTLTGTPTITNTPTPTDTPTITSTPTQTFTVTQTYTPTNSPTITATPTITPTPNFNGIRISKNVFTPNAPVSIAVALDQGPGLYDLSIYNSAGEHIKTLDHQWINGPYVNDYLWNGINKFGDPCASGVYILFLTEPLAIKISRIVLIH